MAKEQAIIQRDDKTQLIVDCYVSQSHTLSSTITSEPVEEGINVSDHIKLNPDVINLRGVVSDYDISLTKTLNTLKTIISSNKQAKYKTNDIFSAFQDIHQKKELVTIITNYKTYTNMRCTSFKTSETKSASTMLQFDANFEEIRFVSDAEMLGRNLAKNYQNVAKDDATKAKVAPKVTAPKKPSVDVTEELKKIQEATQSWLSQFLEWLTGANKAPK